MTDPTLKIITLLFFEAADQAGIQDCDDIIATIREADAKLQGHHSYKMIGNALSAIAAAGKEKKQAEPDAYPPEKADDLTAGINAVRIHILEQKGGIPADKLEAFKNITRLFATTAFQYGQRQARGERLPALYAPPAQNRHP